MGGKRAGSLHEALCYTRLFTARREHVNAKHLLAIPSLVARAEHDCMNVFNTAAIRQDGSPISVQRCQVGGLNDAAPTAAAISGAAGRAAAR